MTYDETVEKVARAMFLHDYIFARGEGPSIHDRTYPEAYDEKAQAILAVLGITRENPTHWLAPMEPTEAMEEAGDVAAAYAVPLAAHAYVAMRDAAREGKE